jgi:hypothetical protein
MAINFEKINAGGISLMANFGYYGDKPLDSRLVIPSLEGLATLIENGAAYEGMIVYDQDTKKTYQVQTIEGVLSYREFGLTQEELNDLITKATTAAMEFKGAAATLPENPAKGDMYKVAGENISIKIDDVDAKLGDSIVYDGTKWFLIPSGDDIEDTWRPVDGVANKATLKFVDGAKTEAVVAADGTIKYNHAAVAAPELLAENEQTRTYITAVETDGFGHITGYKTATENIEDTDTKYTFEGQVESSNVYFNVTPSTEGATEQTVYVDAYSKNEADAKFQPVGEYQPKGDYKTIQEAIEAVATEANVFIDTVAQDTNGVITITTKAVDFTAADDRFKKLQTAIAAVTTVKNVFIDTIAQDAQGIITITTKAVDFSDYQPKGDYKIIQEAKEFTGSTVKTVTKVTQDANGEVEVTYEDIAFPEYVDTNTVTTIVEGAGIEVSAAGEGTEAVTYTVAHADTSDVQNVTAADRTYVKSLTFDDFGHVTGVETGTETVEDTNTTYEFAATANPLEFTVTPSTNGVAGETQTIELVAPTVNVGVTKIVAGNDIVVTPAEGTGAVTVAHEEFATGEYTKDPASSDKTGDVYMMTSVAVDNGHVTGASVKSLAHALMGMTFVFDGGNSTTV